MPLQLAPQQHRWPDAELPQAGEVLSSAAFEWQLRKGTGKLRRWVGDCLHPHAAQASPQEPTSEGAGVAATSGEHAGGVKSIVWRGNHGAVCRPCLGFRKPPRVLCTVCIDHHLCHWRRGRAADN